MVDPRLREALLNKLGVTPQAVSQRVKRLKRQTPMSTEDGWYLLAFEHEIDLSKYLGQATVDRVRQLQQMKALPASRPATRPRPAAPRAVRVTIGRDIKMSDPILPKRLLDDAKLMAGQVYPLIYVFENSLRHLIVRVMRTAHGDSWWSATVPSNVRSKVEGRMRREEQRHWHGRRAAEPIYYTDMGDLAAIVTGNWADFAGLFPSQAWLTHKVDELSVSRNVVAHNNPLSRRDVARVELYVGDWHRQLQGNRHLIP